MKKTSLCYIENNGRILMLFRNKKQNDENAQKWVGIGGKFLPNEDANACAMREVFEETGLKPNLTLRGIITFVSDIYEKQDMYLFYGTVDTDELIDCNEGTLKWVPKEEVLNLPMWEGDHLFLEKLFKTDGYFTMTLTYKGDTLINADTK